jgi:ribonucleoside-triphosphate reductase
MLSGRFCEIDKEIFHHSVHKKNYYTNSFHIDVNAGIPLLEKIEKEGPFHALCNGGCITYVELRSAPLTNILALFDAVQYAEISGVSYMGFNYPLDICNQCGANGTFDKCPECGSIDIKRIRRVSGYLEELDYFTKGKTAEAKERRANA